MAKQESFVDFVISKGYEPFRKVFNKEKNEWEYIPSTNHNFFSCYSPGYMDIRLIKDDKEIIFGVPCDVVDSNGKTKVHHPTLLWPPICGTPDNLFALDNLFKELSYEEILKTIIEYFEFLKK